MTSSSHETVFIEETRRLRAEVEQLHRQISRNRWLLALFALLIVSAGFLMGRLDRIVSAVENKADEIEVLSETQILHGHQSRSLQCESIVLAGSADGETVNQICLRPEVRAYYSPAFCREHQAICEED